MQPASAFRNVGSCLCCCLSVGMHRSMALLCCFCTSVAKAPRSRMSVSQGNKARAGMAGLRTIEVRGQRVTRGRGPKNRAPRARIMARIARLTQIGGPCGIPVHPGDIPTPKGVDWHLQLTPGGAARPPAAQGGGGQGGVRRATHTAPDPGTWPLPPTAVPSEGRAKAGRLCASY